MGKMDKLAPLSIGLAAYLSPCLAFAELKICNNTPYDTQIVIFQGVKGFPKGHGWHYLKYGECRVFTVDSIYREEIFIHAESVDELSEWFHDGRVAWGSPFTQVCVPNHPFDNVPMSYITNPLHLTDIETACGEGWSKIKIEKIKSSEASESNFQWSIELPEFASHAELNAEKWRETLEGRKEYESIILNEDPKFPFRVGVAFEGSDSLSIKKAYPGLPASALSLMPNDIIYSVADREVSTPLEFVEGINRYGFEFGFGKAVQITVVRDGWLMDGWIDLEYYHELDPRRNSTGASEAALAAAWDSAWLGYGSLIRCGGEAFLSDSLNWLFSDNATFSEARKIGECTALHEAYLDRLELMYPDEYWNGDFGGAFFGGLRVLPKAWFRLGTRQAARLIGSRAVARIVVQASTDAADSFLTVIGQSSADQSIDDVFDDAVRAGKIGGGFSAVIHGVMK